MTNGIILWGLVWGDHSVWLRRADLQHAPLDDCVANVDRLLAQLWILYSHWLGSFVRFVFWMTTAERFFFFFVGVVVMFSFCWRIPYTLHHHRVTINTFLRSDCYKLHDWSDAGVAGGLHRRPIGALLKYRKRKSQFTTVTYICMYNMPSLCFPSGLLMCVCGFSGIGPGNRMVGGVTGLLLLC